MSDRPPNIQDDFIKIGLSDPFIRAIVGMVAIALAASFVVSTLGGGLKAALGVGLSLMFGVVLVVLRVLLTNVNSVFVKWLCFIASAIIVFAFLALAVLLVPAVTICWPQVYHDDLGLPACSMASPQPVQRPFAPVPYDGRGISMDPANNKFWIRVNYRPPRQADAERIVGALRQAGYRSDAIATELNEVLTDDRSVGTSLVKTTSAARPIVDEVNRILTLAIPLSSGRIKIFPDDVREFANGDIQVDLF